MIGTVSAAIGFGAIAIEKELPKEDYNLLAAANSTNWKISQLDCDENVCNPIKIETGIDNRTIILKPYWMNCTERNQTTRRCVAEEKVLYTDKELEAQIDQHKDRHLEMLLGKLRHNKQVAESINKTGKVPPINITFKEKKK